jgi:hypothetical protein
MPRSKHIASAKYTGPLDAHMEISPETGSCPQVEVSTNVPASNDGAYPLLSAVLAQLGRPHQAMYTLRDTAEIFCVATRTLQDWVRRGKLVARDLPGRKKFLATDLESFLRNSLRKVKGANEE